MAPPGVKVINQLAIACGSLQAGKLRLVGDKRKSAGILIRRRARCEKKSSFPIPSVPSSSVEGEKKEVRAHGHTTTNSSKASQSSHDARRRAYLCVSVLERGIQSALDLAVILSSIAESCVETVF